MNYTSRSAIETYRSCNRERYLAYFAEGTGLSPVSRSMPLATGIHIHAGIEHLARWLKKKGHTHIENFKKASEPIIEEAVEISKAKYLDYLGEKGFYGKGTETDELQDYTKREQLAITEALVRAWGLRELPNINQRFLVYDVEREIEVPLTDNITLESRCDMLLRERIGKDILCYSLKSAKDFSKWLERGYKDDLQGLLEMHAAEKFLTENNNKHKRGMDYIASNLKGTLADQMLDLLKTKIVADSPMGVKFCFLIKGKKEEIKEYGEGTGRYQTSSSLIRGYKYRDTSGNHYAHSYYFPNSANKSGKGALGKGWEAFEIFGEAGEEVGYIKGWIEMLDSKVRDHSSDQLMFEMQPDCGDIIGKYVVTPVESFRNSEEIKDTVDQITYQERSVFSMIRDYIPELWSQNRQACHYPDECVFIPICHGREAYTDKPVSPLVRQDPLSSGLYERRIPHHVKEREKHEQSIT